MCYKADLHSHTCHSDGDLTVPQLLELASSKGLSHFAITDHDCITGAQEAISLIECSNFNIKLIYGVELSTEFRGHSVHVLGYFPKSVSDTLGPFLELQQQKRRDRAYKMFDLIEEKFGISLDRNEITSRKSIARGTMAKLITASSDYTVQDCFDKIIGDGCPCYIPAVKLSTAQGVEYIKQLGGTAVIAHPCLILNASPEDILSFGADGLEAVYSSPRNDENLWRNLAKENDLIVTAGSDFHRFNDIKHGCVGDCTITGDDLERFLDAVYR